MQMKLLERSKERWPKNRAYYNNFIIDVNVVISALIKKGKTRELLIDSLLGSSDLLPLKVGDG